MGSEGAGDLGCLAPPPPRLGTRAWRGGRRGGGAHAAAGPGRGASRVEECPGQARAVRCVRRRHRPPLGARQGNACQKPPSTTRPCPAARRAHHCCCVAATRVPRSAQPSRLPPNTRPTRRSCSATPPQQPARRTRRTGTRRGACPSCGSGSSRTTRWSFVAFARGCPLVLWFAVQLDVVDRTSGRLPPFTDATRMHVKLR